MSNSNTGVYIFDFDDVLVNFSQEMYSCIRKNWRKYNHWFVDLGLLKPEEIYNRKFFNINEWLINPEFIKLSSSEYTAIQSTIIGHFYNDFFDTSIYDDLTPSSFAEKTIRNPMFMNNNMVKKVYILTRNMSEKQKESKEKFIKKYFNHPKIEVISVNPGENKAELIVKNNIHWNLIVDDEIPNIRNIAERFRTLKNKEFLIPKYGYNKMPEELKLLIEEKGGTIRYYEPFKN